MTGARRRILVAVRHAILICSTVLALAAPAWAAPGDLKLTIGEGRVTLIADSVPVRTILQEWARLGQSQIVNGEKVMGGPVTLRLIDVPEAEALDVVLRSASGYLAAPRPMQMANASQFDRIVILATSRPTTSATGPTPMPQQQQQIGRNLLRLVDLIQIRRPDLQPPQTAFESLLPNSRAISRLSL